ncbi:LysR family transcriptional regulator [Lentzea albida]|uniref:DNA-binding transcriptional regulator, LysR family n=1 Tax=Lentzea albida TaxID=65499 RepID=A0A1H9MSV9_9PSEU|nr:LysR family transcriptional regulator [Lentzea albida]SER26691.1 DNA-binding transcriptional regulator, LysR family [Lentzea albida]
MAEMTLTGLRVVVEVARRGSFTAAADALGYTQSAISRQVGAMEAAVGSPLFERWARGVRPTTACEALLGHARQVVSHVEAAELEIAGLRDRIAGRLAVGAYPTAAASLVPQAIARVKEKHPALTVRLGEAGSPVVLRRLRAGRVEVGVIAVGDGLPDYDLAGLRTESVPVARGLGVAVADGHPFAGQAEVDVRDLAGQVWVVGTGGEGDPQFGAWPTLSSPVIGHEARTWQTRLGLVAAGLGVSVLPGLAADVVPRGVTWVPVRDDGLAERRRTVVVTGQERSPAAEAFVRALRSGPDGA